MTCRRPVVLLLLATACGGSTVASSGTPGGGGAAGSDAGVDGSAGGAGSPGFEAGGNDAPGYNPWADSGPVDAGMFDCMGACCDGTTHYCRIVSGGAAPFFGVPAEAGPLSCSDAGTSTWCVPLPAQCVGAPSCACVGKYWGACQQCDNTGGGVTVHCYAP